MYLWVTCRLPEAFEREQRVSIRQAQEEAGLSALSVRPDPLYIALIKPTQVEDKRVPALLTRIEALLRREKPFVIQLAGVEIEDRALALSIRPSSRLKALRASLQRELMSLRTETSTHFNLPVLYSEEKALLQHIYRDWSQYPNAEQLGIGRFVLLCSEDGKNFRVLSEITV